MDERPLSILQVNTEDHGGGAAMVARNLLRAYRANDCAAWLAVRRRISNDPHILVLPDQPPAGAWHSFWCEASAKLRAVSGQHPGAAWLSGKALALARLGSTLDALLGREDFNYPGTRQLLTLPPLAPAILHCHNLHGGYFDLRTLPWLSQQLPLVLTLHDAWLLSGHCAHSMACERWQTGCGRCPDLTLYPAISRDATAQNWQRKRAIYRRSRLYVATPSRWLMAKVERSMLVDGICEAQVIPNGVDLEVYQPDDQGAARAALGLPPKAPVLLFAANTLRRNVWKDYQTLRVAVRLLAERMAGQGLLCIALGEDAPPERFGDAELRFIPYEPDQAVVARYYQAADVYVHAARVDTFPNTVIEAMACGTPVVATAVGGIPEQVEEGESGFLVPPGEAERLATRIAMLLTDPVLRETMGARSAAIARQRFDLRQQAVRYLSWFQSLVKPGMQFQKGGAV